MLVLALYFLITYVVAQPKYYLGDMKEVTLTKHEFNAHLAEKVVVEQFYILLNDSTMVNFTEKQIAIDRGQASRKVNLTLNLGTDMSPLIATAIAKGVAKIVGYGGAEASPTKVAVTLANVTIDRHINFPGQGQILMAANLPTTFEIFTYQFPSNLKASDFVVQLVYKQSMSSQNFMVYDSLNVTSATSFQNPRAGYRLSGSWMKKTVSPMGSLFLLIGRKQSPFNTYAITSDSISGQYAYVIVDNKLKVTAPASVAEYNVSTNITLNPGGLSNAYWWVIAVDDMTGHKRAINCQSQKSADFGMFEWYTRPIGFVTYPDLPVGKYTFQVVWTDMMTSDANASVYYPMMQLTDKMEVKNHAGMQPTPIEFNRNKAQKLGALTRNQNLTVELTTVFSKVWVQWFKKDSNSSYQNASNGNGTTGWKALGNPAMISVMTPGKMQAFSILVPDALFDNFTAASAKTARLYGWTEDCDMNHFGQIQISGNITVPGPSPSPSNSGGNKLGAGAIVGIVCAVVFVCGVAAWWLCMRGSNNPDRYQKLEQ